MRQQKGTKTKHRGVFRLSDNTYRIVATAIDPKTGTKKFKEKLTREKDPKMTINAAVAYRIELINEIKLGIAHEGVPLAIPRLEALNRSLWIGFVTANVKSERQVKKLGRFIDTHVMRRWGDHLIDKITVGDVDAWIGTLRQTYKPESIRHIVGMFRRIVSKARGQYNLPPLDWSSVTLPTVTNAHAKTNRLNAEQIGAVLPLVMSEYPYYAPMITTLYSLGLRYCHVAAMRVNKLDGNGVITLSETYDVSSNEFRPMESSKRAPTQIALEPRTLELVKAHRRRLMSMNHRGLETGLLFPSERGTRPVGNDQLNDVWKEAQRRAGISKPVTVHGLRHSFHDICRQQGIADAVVKTMAGRAGTEVRDQTKHLHYSQGVTIDEMRAASVALMGVVPVSGTPTPVGAQVKGGLAG